MAISVIWVATDLVVMTVNVQSATASTTVTDNKMVVFLAFLTLSSSNDAPKVEKNATTIRLLRIAKIVLRLVIIYPRARQKTFYK